MARKISEIYNAMIVEKETFSNLSTLLPTGQANPMQSLLTDLTSTSKVAIWRLMFYVVSVGIWIHENLYDNIIAAAIPSTLPWWNKTVKAFQFGDSLTWDGNKYVYVTIDPTAQIVTQCAIIISDGTFYIKVATTVSGALTTLTGDQVSALQSYLDQVIPAGTDYTIVNESADLLQLAYTVYIDPLIINVSDGSLVSDGAIFPVQDAINNYIQYLDQFDFNGIFYVAKLTDAIQAVIGVKNVIANTVQAKYSSLAYTDVLAVASQTYSTISGYLKIDPTYPLTTAITYEL